MEILKIVLTYFICNRLYRLTIIVLLQEGKSAGLGTIGRRSRYILGTE